MSIKFRCIECATNVLLLLKALKHRWLLASCLGLLLAATVGSGVFFFMPPPKPTVRTLIHAPPQRGIVFKQAGGDLSNYQHTQVAMLQSRLVLNSALRDPKVTKLSIVQGQIEPVEWLENEVRADFAVAPEILRITMSGDKPEQLVVLVDAIAQAYRREIVDNEKNQKRERLNTLRELREKFEGQLRERRKVQREMERNAGGHVDLDAFRDDTSDLKNLVKRLIGEEQALIVELEAPTEFKVLEEAQILHAQTQSRMAMMIAGAAATALAAALLAVALWEFRRRRINAV